MRVAYGIQISERDDEYMKMVEDGLTAINLLLSPGKYLVEQLPILRSLPKWMPGAQFRRDAADAKVVAYEMRDTPWSRSLEAMVRSFCILVDGIKTLAHICRAAPGNCFSIYEYSVDGAYAYPRELRS